MARKEKSLESNTSRSLKQRQDSGYASLGLDEESQLPKALTPVKIGDLTRVPTHVDWTSMAPLLSWKDVQIREQTDCKFLDSGSTQGKTLGPQRSALSSLNYRSHLQCHYTRDGFQFGGCKSISF
jgi:hypothetical protein